MSDFKIRQALIFNTNTHTHTHTHTHGTYAFNETADDLVSAAEPQPLGGLPDDAREAPLQIVRVLPHAYASYTEHTSGTKAKILQCLGVLTLVRLQEVPQ